MLSSYFYHETCLDLINWRYLHRNKKGKNRKKQKDRNDLSLMLKKNGEDIPNPQEITLILEFRWLQRKIVHIQYDENQSSRHLYLRHAIANIVTLIIDS